LRGKPMQITLGRGRGNRKGKTKGKKIQTKKEPEWGCGDEKNNVTWLILEGANI